MRHAHLPGAGGVVAAGILLVLQVHHLLHLHHAAIMYHAAIMHRSGSRVHEGVHEGGNSYTRGVTRP